MKRRQFFSASIILAIFFVAGCSGAPSESSLRDSFAQQLSTNKFIKDFQRNGDDLTFTGPGAEGGTAKWRVHIDTAVIEPNSEPPRGTTTEAQPYKGTVTSSWYSNDTIVRPRGRESNLPIELTDNGLGQECWAFWEAAQKRWGW